VSHGSRGAHRGATPRPSAVVALGLRRARRCSRATHVNDNVWRWYLPQLGRYARPDPIGLLAAVAAYRYARSNPLGVGDWLGLQAQPLPLPDGPPWLPAPPIRPVPPPTCRPSPLGALGRTFGVGVSAAIGVILGELFNPAEAGARGLSDFVDPSCRPKCGDCGPSEHGFLQFGVNSACKSVPRRCIPGMTPQQLTDNLWQNVQCFFSRREINERCFRGGDEGHRMAAAQAARAGIRFLDLLTSPWKSIP
jgi:RHS repeat-associated protein